MTKIESEIQKTIFDVTGLTITDTSQNLVNKMTNIMPSDFLYIFEALEQKFKVPMSNIFITHNYDVMTIKNLGIAITDLEKSVLIDG